MDQKTTEIKDLSVERIDGVDRPATRRSFMLFKSEGSQAIMKGYALVATAADAVLKACREEGAEVAKSTQLAVNGLAQVLGQDAVYKAVATQPYEISEPDVDKRGPADESLGSNYTPRKMVGGVELTLKAGAVPMVDEKDEKEKPVIVAERKAVATQEYKVDEAVNGDKRGPADESLGGITAKAAEVKPEDKDKKDEMPPWMKSIAESIEKIAATVEKHEATLAGVEAAIEKAEGDAQPVAKFAFRSKPASRQVQQDEQVAVAKSGGRMGVSFSNIAFQK